MASITCSFPRRTPISYAKRPLTEEEQRLWHHITQEAGPLRAKQRASPPPPPRISSSERPRASQPDIPLMAFDTPLRPGSYAGIDKNTATRFRKGRREFDGTLDLHGMSREQAHHALSNFVHAHYAMGGRCLLIITGKSGVLRELLPQWLDEPGLRAFSLALDVARPQHGGSGAYYLLLRRKR